MSCINWGSNVASVFVKCAALHVAVDVSCVVAPVGTTAACKAMQCMKPENGLCSCSKTQRPLLVLLHDKAGLLTAHCALASAGPALGALSIYAKHNDFAMLIGSAWQLPNA